MAAFSWTAGLRLRCGNLWPHAFVQWMVCAQAQVPVPIVEDLAKRLLELRPIRPSEPIIPRYTDEVIRLILPSIQLAATLQIAGTAPLAASIPPIVEYWQLHNVEAFSRHSIEVLEQLLHPPGDKAKRQRHPPEPPAPPLQLLEAAWHSVHMMQLVAEVYLRAKMASGAASPVGTRMTTFEGNYGPFMRMFLVKLTHKAGALPAPSTRKVRYDSQSIADHLDHWVPSTVAPGSFCELFSDFNESDSALALPDNSDRLHSRLRLKIVASTLAFVAYLSRGDTVSETVGASREDVSVELLLGILQWIPKVRSAAALDR